MVINVFLCRERSGSPRGSDSCLSSAPRVQRSVKQRSQSFFKSWWWRDASEVYTQPWWCPSGWPQPQPHLEPHPPPPELSGLLNATPPHVQRVQPEVCRCFLHLSGQVCSLESTEEVFLLSFPSEESLMCVSVTCSWCAQTCLCSLSLGWKKVVLDSKGFFWKSRAHWSGQ